MGQRQGTMQAACDESDTAMLHAYLERIGVDKSIVKRAPNAADLELLLQAHLTSVPFENLGQHEHPATDEFPAVAKRNPRLDVRVTLDKIVNQRRGGFCFEVNFAFCWLLRNLGYVVRLGMAHAFSPHGFVPGHLVLLVDGIDPSGDSLLVDPGFGDAIRACVPISGSVTDTMCGDTFALAPASEFDAEAGSGNAGPKRFSKVLTRARAIGSNSAFWEIVGTPVPPPEPIPPKPAFTFNPLDDLEYECEEFQQGLATVLADVPENIFAMKQICVLATADGHITLGKDYVKTVVRGIEVNREEVPSEDARRRVLKERFGSRVLPLHAIACRSLTPTAVPVDRQ